MRSRETERRRCRSRRIVPHCRRRLLSLIIAAFILLLLLRRALRLVRPLAPVDIRRLHPIIASLPLIVASARVRIPILASARVRIPVVASARVSLSAMADASPCSPWSSCRSPHPRRPPPRPIVTAAAAETHPAVRRRRLVAPTAVTNDRSRGACTPTHELAASGSCSRATRPRRAASPRAASSRCVTAAQIDPSPGSMRQRARDVTSRLSPHLSKLLPQ
jgi:hypothetical protein